MLDRLNKRHDSTPPTRAEPATLRQEDAPGVHGEALRFLLVGGSAALIDLLLYLLLAAVGVPVPVAKAVSFAAAGTAAYVGNKHFTYRRQAKGASSVILYAMLYAVTLGLNVAVNDFIIAVLELPRDYEIGLAWTIATGLSAIVNFVGTKFLIFRGERLPSTSSRDKD